MVMNELVYVKKTANNKFDRLTKDKSMQTLTRESLSAGKPKSIAKK
jgi:hypothetical protein